MTPDFGQPAAPRPASRVNGAHAAARLIVLALAASIVIETLIAYSIANSREPRVVSTDSRYPFYVGAVFLAFGSIAYRRAQMRRLRLEVVAGLRGVEGLVKHLFQVTLVSAAMAELIGIMTIMVAIFVGDTMDVVRFGIVALVVELFTYPRLQAWQRAVDFFATPTP